MRIAAAQIKVSSEMSENLDKILKFIKKAKKTDVICFPELSLQSDETDVKSIIREVKKISECAKKYKINVIFGAYVREDKKIKNKIFVINKNGELIHRYNKRNPYMSEQSFVSGGKVNRPFILDGIPCAVVNCWDYAFPEYLRKLAREGALVFFCPTYLLSHPLTHNVLQKIPQVRAFDTMSYFIMVDAISEETYKHSRICHPLHEIAFVKNKEKIIYAEIDINEILDLRSKLKNL